MRLNFGALPNQPRCRNRDRCRNRNFEWLDSAVDYDYDNDYDNGGGWPCTSARTIANDV